MTIETAVGAGWTTPESPFQAHLVTNFFRPLISDARNNSSVLFSLFSKMAPEQVSGRFIIWVARNGRNRGRNAIGPGGQLPDPGSQGAATYAMETRTYFARIKVAGEILRRQEMSAFADVIAYEGGGVIDDIKVDYGRILNNDGSGRIMEVSSFSGTTLTVRNNQSIEGQSVAGVTGMADRYFEPGDRISFVDPDSSPIRPHGGTAQLAFYVVAVLTPTTIQISLTAGGAALDLTASPITGLAAGDWIVRASNDSTALALLSTAFRREQMGIGGVFNDDGVLDGNGLSGAQQTGSSDLTTTSIVGAPFQGIAATAANPWNRGVILDSSGAGLRPISEDLMQQAMSDAEERNNANIQLIHSAYPIYNRYVSGLRQDKRYTNTTELKGGHTSLEFNGVPWLKDRFAYKNQVTFMDPDEFSVMEVEMLKPLAPLGLPQWERLHDTDDYFTGWVDSWNLGVNVRQRAGARLVDLNA